MERLTEADMAILKKKLIKHDCQISLPPNMFEKFDERGGAEDPSDADELTRVPYVPKFYKETISFDHAVCTSSARKA